MYTAIKLFGGNKINFITVFSNKIPEVAVNTVNIDYTILGQVCTVSTAQPKYCWHHHQHVCTSICRDQLA